MRGGWIEVRGSDIVALGTGTPGSGVDHDWGDVVILPGLVNAHCHLELTDLSGKVPFDGRFANWLKQVVALKRSWQGTDYEASGRRGVDLLADSGATSVCDIVSWWPLAGRLHSTPFRVWTCLEMIDFTGQRSWRDWVGSAETLIRQAHPARGGWGLSPHAPYTATDALYRAAAGLLAKLPGAPLLTTHVCESGDERAMFEEGGGELYEWLVRIGRDMYDCGGLSPLERLGTLGVLGPRTLGVHLNGLDESEIELVTDTGMSVVHCPTSHRFFGHEPFPLEPLLARGVHVCVGTDSLASAKAGATLDMFAELRALRGAFPGLSCETILQLATLNGARALQAADRIGSIEGGKCADLIGLRVTAGLKTDEVPEAVVTGKLPLAFVMVDGHYVRGEP